MSPSVYRKINKEIRGTAASEKVGFTAPHTHSHILDADVSALVSF
jgi:hypothetical protein